MVEEENIFVLIFLIYFCKKLEGGLGQPILLTPLKQTSVYFYQKLPNKILIAFVVVSGVDIIYF